MKSAPTVVRRFAGIAEDPEGGRNNVGSRCPVGGMSINHAWAFTSASARVPSGETRISSASAGGFRVHSQPLTRRWCCRSLPSQRTETSPSIASVNQTRVESFVKCGTP
jgi:hypothetical protein